MTAIHIELPASLSLLAHLPRDLHLTIEGPVTQHTILETLEHTHPILRGTIRDPNTRRRRPFIRFFACQQDLSHNAPDDPMPPPVATGTEPLLIIAAIAGG